MKLHEWLDTWLNKYAKLSIKQRSYLQYKESIEKHINPILGDYELTDLSANVLQEFVIQKLESGNLKTGKGLSSNSVIGIVGVLKQALHQALVLEMITKDNSNLIKMPTVQEKLIEAFEIEEQNKVVDYCMASKKPNHFGIVLCFYTGLRIGELLALTWNDIDFDKKTMSINKSVFYTKINGKYETVIDTPKTKHSIRVIPLPKQILDKLKEIKKSSTSKYVFTTRDNKMVNVRTYQRTFERILKKLNINVKNFHALRHTFATRAIEMGMDVKTVSEILGHNSPVITLNRYSHSLMSYKTEMMAKMGKMLDRK